MHKLAVKLEGIERRKRTTGVLHIAAGFFLLLQTEDYLGVHQYQQFWNSLPFLMAAVISVLYGFFRKNWDPDARRNRWVRLIQVCAFTFLAINTIPFGRTIQIILLFAWAIGCLLLMFTERKVFQDAEMVFNHEGIYIPGYFSSKRLFWNSIASVVIRPDFVTIFQVNDRFLQYEVLKKMPQAVLDEIALYCNTQLQQRGIKTENL